MDCLIGVDPVAGRRGADCQAILGRKAYLLGLGYVLDVDEELDLAPPLPGLNDNVGAACKDAGYGTRLLEQANGLVNRTCA